MTSHQWERLIAQAAAEPESDITKSLVAHLESCGKAKSILRSKQYGSSGMAMDQMAALVPHARDYG